MNSSLYICVLVYVLVFLCSVPIQIHLLFTTEKKKKKKKKKTGEICSLYCTYSHISYICKKKKKKKWIPGDDCSPYCRYSIILKKKKKKKKKKKMGYQVMTVHHIVGIL